MNNDDDGGVPEPGLSLYWYETKPNEQPWIWWGQLTVVMGRLVADQREFSRLRRIRDLEEALRRLELCVESYMLRAFEARERALGLLASRTNRKV